MDIGEEHGRVLLNLSDVEALASVLAVRSDTSAERSREAADAVPGTLAFTSGVREGNTTGENRVSIVSCTQTSGLKRENVPRRTGLADSSLVNMGSRGRRRLVVTTEASDGNVVANHIVVGVDAKLEDAAASLKSTSRVVVRVNNILRLSLNVVSRGKRERTVLLVVVGPGGEFFGVGLNGRGSCRSNEAESKE